MAVQILAGSTGIWKSKKIPAKGNFVVCWNTCSDSKKIPVIFERCTGVTYLNEMDEITWTNMKTEGTLDDALNKLEIQK